MTTRKISQESIYNTLYDFFNGPRIRTAPRFLNISMYGNYTVQDGQFWEASYSDIGIDKSFIDEDGELHNTFKIAHSIFKPEKQNKKMIPSIILFHGVPVNKADWFDVAMLLARFMNVIVIDLLGMGDSSKPLDFVDNSGNSYWSWNNHAVIYKKMINDFKKTNPEFFLNGQIFMGGNDWGGGVVQKYVELYGNEDLHGALIGSSIALDGYWVQHIGSLKALNDLPYPSDTFNVSAVQFQGTLTMLMETMFHRTSDIQNQYTMALLQEPYVEISYSNPLKNPNNTIYNSHSVKVLAQQATFILGNGALLPFHSEKNPGGIKFFYYNVPILMIWGKNDKMMPEGQVQKFANIFEMINYMRRKNGIRSNLRFTKKVIKNAGHFASTDQPEEFADEIIHWVRNIAGPETLNIAYVGMTEIARKGEKELINNLNSFYNS